MPLLDTSQTPSFANGFRFQWEEAQDCYVLLYPEGMIKLNSTAGEILKLVDAKQNVSDIVNTLQAKFGQNDSIESDVHAFVEEAVAKNWIRLS